MEHLFGEVDVGGGDVDRDRRGEVGDGADLLAGGLDLPFDLVGLLLVGVVGVASLLLGALELRAGLVGLSLRGLGLIAGERGLVVELRLGVRVRGELGLRGEVLGVLGVLVGCLLRGVELLLVALAVLRRLAGEFLCAPQLAGEPV